MIENLFFNKRVKMILIILLVIAVLIFLFFTVNPVFGGKPDKTSLDKIHNSKNFDGEKFVNLIPTTVMFQDSSNENKSNSAFKEMFLSKDKKPSKPLPSIKVQEENILDESITWLGHSTVLIKTQNTTIITDPVFYKASPVFFFGKPFEVENKTKISDLPKINVVVISHDHYDHLDYKAIKKLGNDVDKYLVPLGVKAHLVRWGIDENKIEEKDWHENVIYSDINFTLVPSRHFSGRRFSNRGSTLWGGWVIKSSSNNIFFSGDGGYSLEFEKIGEKYGPFDISLIEDGAYNEQWKQIHMMPEESVNASMQLNSKIVMPIHWAKFRLAPHKWDEPIIRFLNEAKKNNLKVATPMIGETFTLDNIPQKEWWK